MSDSSESVSKINDAIEDGRRIGLLYFRFNNDETNGFDASSIEKSVNEKIYNAYANGVCDGLKLAKKIIQDEER